MASVRTSVMVGVLALFSVRQSVAGPAFAGFCTAPNHIVLVGSRAGAPDARGSFTVVVHDLANRPLYNRDVVIDLSGCPDLTICSDQLDPTVTVDCAAKRLGKLTDITGTATFTMLGASNGVNNATTLQGGAKVLATNGVLLRQPTASAFDLDGSSGVGINDLTVWLNDFGAPGNPPYGRSDFDGDGKVNINDLSVWLAEFGAGGSSQGCAASCP